MTPTVTLSGDATAGDAVVIAIPFRPSDAAPHPTAAAGPGAEVAAGLGVDVDAILAARSAKAEAGEIVEVPLAAPDGVQTLLLVGVGDGSPAALRTAAAAMVRKAGKSPSLATFLCWDSGPDAVAAAVEAAVLARFSFRVGTPIDDRPSLDVRFLVAQPANCVRAFERARTVAGATALARELAATPSLEKTPQWMVDRITALAASADLDVRVWDERALLAEGFGGISAVGRASARPPRLVQLSYRPRRSSGHVVLVGKGITFDSGGLSLKRPEGMTAMKTDMSGAAAVVATMSALKPLGVRRRVTALLPLAENLVGGDAMRPGDVLRHYGGTTVEVLNTDAEGRLVLADALAYAEANLAPDVLIDLATLTGAATLGLGKRHAALYGTDPGLVTDLVAAGVRGGERLWPMPLVESYRDSLDSPVADLRNIGDPAHKYSGGSIVAALFLREFVRSVPWAHLDIAGTARADGDEGEITKGPTGFGVRTLLAYLDR